MAQSSQQGPHPLSMRDLTKQQLPNLIQNDNRTRSISIHDGIFIGPLGYWNTFERDVRQCFDNYSNMPNFGNTIAYRKPAGTINLDYEQCAVGNETGVVGRITHNVGHVMTAVAQGMGMRLRFGDWRASHGETLRDIPDLAILDDRSAPRIAGEVKTPWTVDLAAEFTTPGQGGLFRRLLGKLSLLDQVKVDLTQYSGQIVNYMYVFRLTYGFITTYDETVFLKIQEHGNSLVLIFSNVINHSTTSRDVNPGEVYEGKVSLRECMLYFFHRTSQDEDEWKFRPTFKKEEWFSDEKQTLNANKNTPVNKKDPVRAPASSRHSGQASSASGHPSSSKTVYGAGTGRSNGGYQEFLRIRVKWDRKNRNYLYCISKNPPKMGFVEDYSNKGGRLSVRVNGKFQEAEVIGEV